MNYYYEIADGKYMVQHDLKLETVIDPVTFQPVKRYWFNFSTMFDSNRVWAESEDGVKFVKHRFADPKTVEVDLKEFMWIKLKAQEV